MARAQCGSPVNEGDQKPQAAFQIFAEMGKIEFRESLEVFVPPRPKSCDEPARNHHWSNDWNKHTNATEEEIHHPFRALEEIGDGVGVVHGDERI